MPISQKTILTIYGLLAAIAELSEAELGRINQPDLLSGHAPDFEDARLALAKVELAARVAQAQAITSLMADDSSIEINPLTGRIS